MAQSPFAPIPMPQNPMDAFLGAMATSQSMFDSMMKNKLTPYQAQLYKAQAEEAQGKAAQSNMLAHLINGLINPDQIINKSNSTINNIQPDNLQQEPTGNNPPQDMNSGTINPGGVTPVNMQNINLPSRKPGQESMPIQSSQKPFGNGMNPGLQKSNLAAALLGIPVGHEMVDGKLVTINPLTGTSTEQIGQTPQQQAELKMQVGRSNAFSGQDAKLVNTLDTQSASADQTLNTLGDIGKIIYTPEWSEMRKLATIPGGGKASLWWYAHNGTPEQQQMAGQFISTTGQVVANMASQFKGQFRKGEQQLISGIKINDTDTPALSQGKFESLVSMENFLKQRNNLTSKLVRQGLSPPDANEQADRTLNGDLVRKIISVKSGQEGQSKNVQKNAETQPSSQVMKKITIIDSNGDEHEIDEDKIEMAKKRDPDLKVKGQ